MATVVEHTLKSSGGDYTTFASWESAQNTDLVSEDKIKVLRCFITLSANPNPTLAGWVTDETRYIKIIADSSVAWLGKTVTEGGLRAYSEGTTNFCGNWDGAIKVWFDGFRLGGYTGGTLAFATQPANSSSHIIFTNCRITSVLQGTDWNGLTFPFVVRSGTADFVNCFLVSRTQYSALSVESGTANIYNCSFRSGVVAAGGTVNAKNCFASNDTFGSSGYAAFGGTFNLTTCASQNASGSIGLRNIAFTTANFANVTQGDGLDLRLVSGSALIGVGTTISESGPFSYDTDADGGYRGKSTWDVGYDQFTHKMRTYSPFPSFRRP